MAKLFVRRNFIKEKPLKAAAYWYSVVSVKKAAGSFIAGSTPNDTFASPSLKKSTLYKSSFYTGIFLSGWISAKGKGSTLSSTALSSSLYTNVMSGIPFFLSSPVVLTSIKNSFSAFSMSFFMGSLLPVLKRVSEK